MAYSATNPAFIKAAQESVVLGGIIKSEAAIPSLQAAPGGWWQNHVEISGPWSRWGQDYGRHDFPQQRKPLSSFMPS